jgi:hypothetical protein
MRNSTEESKPLGTQSITLNNHQTKVGTKTKLAGQLRTPNPGREARHTRPLDVLGFECEINEDKQTPEGCEFTTRQTTV